MALKCTGFIETLGLAAAIEAADTAVKSANVKLIGYEYTKGDGMCTVKVEGDVGAVKAAIAAASISASKVWGVYSTDVIARPAAGIDMLIHNADATIGYENQEAAKEEIKIVEPTIEEEAKEILEPVAKEEEEISSPVIEEEAKEVSSPIIEEEEAEDAKPEEVEEEQPIEENTEEVIDETVEESVEDETPEENSEEETKKEPQRRSNSRRRRRSSGKNSKGNNNPKNE